MTNGWPVQTGPALANEKRLSLVVFAPTGTAMQQQCKRRQQVTLGKCIWKKAATDRLSLIKHHLLLGRASRKMVLV